MEKARLDYKPRGFSLYQIVFEKLYSLQKNKEIVSFPKTFSLLCVRFSLPKETVCVAEG